MRPAAATAAVAATRCRAGVFGARPLHALIRLHPWRQAQPRMKAGGGKTADIASFFTRKPKSSAAAPAAEAEAAAGGGTKAEPSAASSPNENAGQGFIAAKTAPAPKRKPEEVRGCEIIAGSGGAVA